MLFRSARARLENVVDVLESTWIDEGVTTAVKEFAGWLGEFEQEGLVELDYGSVASMFSEESLLEDRSAAEVETCIEALQAGDLVKAGRLFSTLSDRWTEIRAHEVMN